eukprot:scaffold16069_cov69-Phaeocystis_antarctica.AAC.2
MAGVRGEVGRGPTPAALCPARPDEAARLVPGRSDEDVPGAQQAARRKHAEQQADRAAHGHAHGDEPLAVDLISEHAAVERGRYHREEHDEAERAEREARARLLVQELQRRELGQRRAAELRDVGQEELDEVARAEGRARLRLLLDEFQRVRHQSLDRRVRLLRHHLVAVASSSPGLSLHHGLGHDPVYAFGHSPVERVHIRRLVNRSHGF